MKKFFISMIALGFFVGIFSTEIKLIAQVYLGDPTIHIVQEGESISKIAKKYYSNASYWRELALINMAPNPDLIISGEQILIPSLELIQQLHQAKTISTVKNLVINKDLSIKGSNRNKTDYTESNSASGAEKVRPLENSKLKTAPPLHAQPNISSSTKSKRAGFPWIWMIALLMFVGGIVGLFLYRRQNRTEVEYDRPHKSTNSRKTLNEIESEIDINESTFSPKSIWDRSEDTQDGERKEKEKETLVVS